MLMGKRLYWEGAPERRAAGQGTLGQPLCHKACSLRFHGDGLDFGVCLGQSSCLVHTW